MGMDNLWAFLSFRRDKTTESLIRGLNNMSSNKIEKKIDIQKDLLIFLQESYKIVRTNQFKHL
jgi:hypothetical protein